MRPDERERYLLHARSAAYHRRLQRANEAIAEALQMSEKPYVSFSGGKDSTVLLDLVRRQKPDIEAAFFDSGAEFPDTIAFIEHLIDDGLDVQWVEPAYNMLELYEMVGAFSGKKMVRQLAKGEMSRILIKEPAKLLREQGYDLAFIGLRAQESKFRTKNFGVRGHIYHTAYDDLYHAIPLATWHPVDIWAYIVSEDIPYNAVYDKEWPGGREAIRVGAYAGSTDGTLSHGRWAFVKRHYPDVWREFCKKFPAATRYV
ncbi:phosphoadenosine phosphosulfate reductase family protein [Alicyclobacillus suci]|uniref:phosphoadenosine phosphosulfate reductase family protein n=1 Tax=Alicyclobacillus suci TaxID=2816080 RepID=UPI001A8EDE08|nr:phosphoadenosine phosphosulfate reductase family protein [Alicyclobacillus suci]